MLRDGSGGARQGGDAAAGGVADDACADRSGLLARPDPGELLSLSRLSGAALTGLERKALLGVLGDIERVANQLAGYRAEVLGALDALSRSGAAPDAAPHLSLRDATGVSERDARNMVRAAGKAREHAGVLEAMSQGGINAAQAEALCDARVPEAVRADLVAAAAGEDTDATRRRVRKAEASHCAETPMERFQRQRRARGAGWQTDHDGMLRLWAKLDPEVGAAVEANLEVLRRQYWLDDKQVRTGRRTPAQRDADVLAYALAGITLTDTDAAAAARLHARAQRDSHPADQPAAGNSDRRPRPSRRTTPSTNGTKPNRGTARRNRVAPAQPGDAQPSAAERDGPALDGRASTGSNHDGTASWDSARRLPPAQISVLIELDALRGRTDETGLTDAGVELPPEIVRRLACDAEVIPMILGSPGTPADVGRKSRTVPLRLRRLLIARDRHCRWPGCAQPPSRCDAHHVHHWIDGGRTDLDNLVLLCHQHHHHLHQHGYKMISQADGTWAAIRHTEPEPATRPQRSARQPHGP